MTTDQLSATFAALADPTRRAILARLMQGEATVNELAAAAPQRMTLPSISRHLKVLESAGLIRQSREKQWRPRHLNAAQLRKVDAWTARYRLEQVPFPVEPFDPFFNTNRPEDLEAAESLLREGVARQ